MKKHRLLAVLTVALVAALAIAAAAVGGKAPAREDRAAGASNTISVTAIWGGAEQRSFEAVLKRFNDTTTYTAKYTSGGDQLPTTLATQVRGGNPPDIAVLGQPGLLRDFARRKALKPITFARGAIRANFAPDWLRLGTVNGTLYGLFYKGANKSTIWYNVPAFRSAGVTPPATFPALIRAARTIRASGVPPFSIGGADGWTLTDLFENIYLRQAGGALYDRLAAHTIPWTHPSVKRALRTMAQIVGDPQNIAGGVAGALQTDFPTSVSQVFRTPPRAAMVIEGDFVGGVISDSTRARPRTGYNVFNFPTIGGRQAVVGGGDVVVMFRDTPAARALIRFLASPQAAAIWARRGGYASPNRRLSAGTYPDAITRTTASALARARTFRFDLSDLQPSAFGGTVGQGLFKLFQDFVRTPTDVDGIARKMEQAAARAYKG